MSDSQTRGHMTARLRLTVYRRDRRQTIRRVENRVGDRVGALRKPAAGRGVAFGRYSQVILQRRLWNSQSDQVYFGLVLSHSPFARRNTEPDFKPGEVRSDVAPISLAPVRSSDIMSKSRRCGSTEKTSALNRQRPMYCGPRRGVNSMPGK
jgi:hypothetical protein